jgi:hydrogenase maturation protease
VGREIVRRFQNSCKSDVEIIQSNGDAADLVLSWENARQVIIIDATNSGSNPGTIRRFDASKAKLPVEFSAGVSTHGWGVSEAIELSRALKTLPPQVIVIGIEGAGFEMSGELSDKVRAAIPEVIEMILKELNT